MIHNLTRVEKISVEKGNDRQNVSQQGVPLFKLRAEDVNMLALLYPVNQIQIFHKISPLSCKTLILLEKVIIQY